MSLFTKVLTDADVERTLSFPEGYKPASSLLQGYKAVALLVKDDIGMSWNFVCATRSGVFPKLVILSGWIQFVRSRRLRKGDIVIFYKEDDRISGAHYKIEVRRISNTLTSVIGKDSLSERNECIETSLEIYK